MKNDTIIAPSSAHGRGAVALVRLSGDKSVSLLKDVFSAFENISDRKAVYGTLKADAIKDDVIVVFYKAPHSYTGEDVVEIFCHGSPVVVEAVIKNFIKRGARIAERGEFTRRAFENGKLSLTEAEGIIDLIDSQCESAARAAYNLASGKLSHTLAEIKDKMTDLAAQINVGLDYPEEDLSSDIDMNVGEKIKEIKKEVGRILKTYDSGKKATGGIKVVIAGRPNVGKSTLLNALVGYERAIVTEEEGTTRDTVEETYIYKGARFIVTDTAGVRENAVSKAEKLGIERSIEAVKEADCVLLLDDELKSVAGERGIKVRTKADLGGKREAGAISVSGKTGDGIDTLKEKIYRRTADFTDEVMLTNLRQFEALGECADCLEKAEKALNDGEPDEIVSMELFAAISAAASVDGATATKQVVDKIFSRFCVGK